MGGEAATLPDEVDLAYTLEAQRVPRQIGNPVPCQCDSPGHVRPQARAGGRGRRALPAVASCAADRSGRKTGARRRKSTFRTPVSARLPAGYGGRGYAAEWLPGYAVRRLYEGERAFVARTAWKTVWTWRTERLRIPRCFHTAADPSRGYGQVVPVLEVRHAAGRRAFARGPDRLAGAVRKRRAAHIPGKAPRCCARSPRWTQGTTTTANSTSSCADPYFQHLRKTAQTANLSQAQTLAGLASFSSIKPDPPDNEPPFPTRCSRRPSARWGIARCFGLSGARVRRIYEE